MSDKNTWWFMVGCLYFPSPSLNSIYIILIFLLQLYGLGPVTCPNSELLLKLWSTSTSSRTPWTRDQPDARPLPTQDSTTQKHKDKHPCHKRDSNPRSQWPGDQGLSLGLYYYYYYYCSCCLYYYLYFIHDAFSVTWECIVSIILLALVVLQTVAALMRTFIHCPILYLLSLTRNSLKTKIIEPSNISLR
jgi:hypothetical protein